jgi:Tricorn protease C1 domain
MGDKWFLTSAPGAGKPGEGVGPPKSGEGTVKPGEGAVKLEDVEVKIDPRAEWRQIYKETWRIERDFLYDPNAHGLDLAAAEKKYEPYVAGLGSRHDLSLLGIFTGFAKSRSLILDHGNFLSCFSQVSVAIGIVSFKMGDHWN